MRYFFKLFFVFLFLLFFTFNIQAEWNQDFQNAWNSFHSLMKNDALSKYRSSWLNIADKFQKVYNQDKLGPYAPKSLFFLGRVYEELGWISCLQIDQLKSIEYFQQVIRQFYSHSWADDASLHIARVYAFQLKDYSKAINELNYLLKNYPHGDMVSRAKGFLLQLKKKVDESKTDVQENLYKSSSQLNSNKSILSNIRYWSNDDYTRVVLDFDKEVQFKEKLLNPDPKIINNYRLVIDLNQVEISSNIEKEQLIIDGILRNIRIGKQDLEQVRLVLDIENIRDTRVFSLSNPFRIVIDIFGDENAKKIKKTLIENKKVNSEFYKKKKITKNIVEQLGLKVKTIMIDAGHGGKDPGAIANNTKEKTVNLEFALILGDKLEKKGYNVIYTRKKDIFIPLEERSALANSKNVDIFISIHCNSYSKDTAHGLEVYYLDLAKSKSAVRVAARENAVSEKKISDLQFILTDLMLNSKITESKDLAKNVHEKTITNARKKYYLKSHGVHGAPFYVLMGSKMPAILVELGYLTNKNEVKKLRSKKYLNILADGICLGIDSYRSKIERYSNEVIK